MTHSQARAQAFVMPLFGGSMDAKEAGRLMAAYRREKGLTQPQVAEQTSIPSAQYLSALEKARYDIRNSDHFPQLVRLYGLTPEQVRELDPLAVISYDLPDPTPPGKRARRVVRTPRAVTGDMTFHAAPQGFENVLTYDKKNASGLLLTEAGERYWVWFEENVPSGHAVLGTLSGWALEARPAPPETH